MARVRTVTRTVEVNTFEVMTCNVETAEVRIIEYKLGGTYDKKADTLKQLKTEYETETLKLVAIQGVKTETILYGMPEAKFIELAEIMPPRNSNDTDEE